MTRRKPASSGGYAPQVGAQPNNDPLGVSAQQRSTAGALQGVQNLQFGADPLGVARNAAMQSYQNSATDPQRFNTMMQTIKERAPGGIAPSRGRGRYDAMPGLPNSPFQAPSTMWQPGQTSAVSGRPFQPQQALQALKGVR